MATSMASDELVFSMSSQTEGTPIVFIKRDWLSILDNQNQSYQSNQCVVDTSQLSNSNKYMNYSEANLIVPLLLTVTAPTQVGAANLVNTFNPNLAGVIPGDQFYSPCDWAFGLKNWLGSIVHSFTCDMNGTTIIQATSYIGLWNTFQMLTSFSYNDFTSWANIGFYPDTAESAVVTIAGGGASFNGTGSCNNNNSFTPVLVGFAPVTANAPERCQQTPVGNLGFYKRQAMFNFDAFAGNNSNLYGIPARYQTYGNLLNGGLNQAQGSQQTLTSMYKSYIFNQQNNQANVAGVWQQAIVGIIKLKHLHSFWQEIPLMKGVFFKMTLNLNNTYFQVTKAVAGDINTLTVANMTSPLGGVNPLVIAGSNPPVGVANYALLASGSNSLKPATYTMSIAVGGKCLCPIQTAYGPGLVQDSPLLRSVTLNVPSYTFNPIFETSYLSQTVKTVVYNDLYQYYIPSVPSGGNFNNLITNGIAGIQSVLVLPYYTSAANEGISPLQSPFGMEGGGPTSPLCLINNFNVIVSGAQMIYQTEKYTYEQFVQQLYGYNQLNGGLNDEINSGLIDQNMFDRCYNYYYVNCARKLPIEQSVPMSVNIIGQNMSAREVSLYVFVCYQTQVSLDVLTGARV